MAYSEELAARVRAAFPPHAQVQERKMFGGLAFLLGGHMGCGILGDRLMVRVPPEEYETILAEPQVKVMDFTGRPMRGFINVEPAGIESEEALARWVRRGAAFASSLPPK